MGTVPGRSTYPIVHDVGRWPSGRAVDPVSAERKFTRSQLSLVCLAGGRPLSKARAHSSVTGFAVSVQVVWIEGVTVA